MHRVSKGSAGLALAKLLAPVEFFIFTGSDPINTASEVAFAFVATSVTISPAVTVLHGMSLPELLIGTIYI